jgi:hypothetical protein
MPKARTILQLAAETLDQRGTQYDSPDTGERSMHDIVTMFNTLTGKDLTEKEGWMFMCCLKLVRLAKTHGISSTDSIVDLVGYASLISEAENTKEERDYHRNQPELEQ